MALANHLQLVEAEKQKLRTQVRRLCQENAWLRDELASTQQRLQSSEQTVVQLEEEKRHLEFMNSVSKYDQDVNDDNASEHSRSEKTDPVVDLFPDDDNEDRQSKRPNDKDNKIFTFIFQQICRLLHQINFNYLNKSTLATKFQPVFEHFTISSYNMLPKVDTKWLFHFANKRWRI